MGCPEMALEGLEFLAILQADDMIGRNRLTDGCRRLSWTLLSLWRLPRSFEHSLSCAHDDQARLRQGD